MNSFIFHLLRKIVVLIVKLVTLFSRKVILFESYPELDGSPWMIYLELQKRGYGKKYKLVWTVDSSFKAPSGVCSVPFFGRLSLWQKLKRFFYKASAKAIVDSNRYIYKADDNTFRLYTRHGGTLKKVDQYSNSIGKIDCILSLSDEMAEIEASLVYKDAGIDRKFFCPLGYPNNDELFNSLNPKLNVFWKKVTENQFQYDKIIGWMPTFRKHKFVGRTDSTKVYPFGIPLLYSIESFETVNEILKKKNILLALKIHHSQMVDFPQISFSNIKIIPQDVQEKYSIPMMDLIKSFDALITDYSSIYHEYILLNRPVALAIDDFEEYSSKTGFAIDYFEWIKGVYLKDSSDLVHFIENVADGIDIAKAEREKTMHRIYKFIDNQSTKRVVDFLVENAKL